jgi:aromatic-L-amino-acid decarboxylase
VRDRTTLSRAFAFSTSHLVLDLGGDELTVDYMDNGPQLSRSFKAFKIWSALQTFGVEAFRSAIDHTLDLAQYMASLIEAEPDLELMAPVPLTAVCFRIGGASKAGHAAVLAALLDEGTAVLGPVSLDGRPGIRACIANYRTTHADIDLIVGRLSDIACHYR